MEFSHNSSSVETADFPEYVLSKNQVASDANVALVKAAVAGSITGVTNALKKGAKPNYFHRPEDQKNAFHIAAENGNCDMLELLVEHGAVVDAVVATTKDTAFMLAAQQGHLEVMKLLQRLGANINAGMLFYYFLST